VDADDPTNLLRVWQSLRSFVFLDTRRLVALSEWDDKTARLKLSISLAGIAWSAMVYASSRIYLGNELSGEFIGWSVSSAVLFAVLIAAPALAGYRIARLKRLSFALNVILIQQAFLAGAVIIASLVLIMQEPARTDFSLLRDGVGDRTLAYRQLCGGLESAARVLKLNEIQIHRTELIQRETEKTMAWGDPRNASVVQAFHHLPSIISGVDRDKRNLISIARNNKELAEIAKEREAVGEMFSLAYPTVSYAEAIFGALFLTIISMSVFHVWRGMDLGDRGENRRFAAVSAAVLATAIAVGFVWWIALSGDLLLYRDLMSKDLPSPETNMTLEDNRKLFEKYKAALLAEKKEHEQQAIDLRGNIYRMRHICPKLQTLAVTAGI
jgi:hypothetical protein